MSQREHPVDFPESWYDDDALARQSFDDVFLMDDLFDSDDDSNGNDLDDDAMPLDLHTDRIGTTST